MSADTDGAEMSVENNLHSKARQARRAKKELELVAEAEVIDLLEVSQAASMITYPSELLLTEYNIRLPAWRLRTRSDKEQWRSWYEYQFVILSMSLGFSNFVYFPVYAAKYGSGTFVICYIVAELVIGFPILFLELAVGQFSSKDITRTFSVVPLSAGVGVSLMVYNVVNIVRLNFKYAWIVYFMYNMYDHTSPTSWDDCNWNRADEEHFTICNYIEVDVLNATNFKCIAKFFYERVEGGQDECLHTGTSLFSPRAMHWPLVACMVLVNTVCYFLVFKGVKSVGKASLWAIPIMTFVIFVFLATELFSHPESMTGIQRLFIPKWGFWRNAHMWFRATSLVFQSLNLDTGSMIIIGSYARFKSSAHIYAFYVCLADICVALLSGSIISGFITVITKKSATPVDFVDMINAIPIDYDLGYLIIMATAIDEVFKLMPLWTAIFFISLLVISVISQAGCILLLLKSLYEFCPSLKKRQWLTNMGAMVLCFFLTLPFLTSGSGAARFTVNLLQFHPTILWPHVSVVLIVSTFIYGYGLTRISQDIDFMLEYYPNKVFSTIWIFTPCWIVIMVILRLTYVTVKPFEKPNDAIVCWCIFSLFLLPTVTVGLWKTAVYARRGEWSKLLYTHDDYDTAIGDLSLITPLSDDEPDSHQRIVRQGADIFLEGVITPSVTSASIKKRVNYNVDDGGGSSSSGDETLRARIRTAGRRSTGLPGM